MDIVTEPYHLHLVSDATGETTHGVARACLAQFEGVEVIEHLWPMVRNKSQIDLVLRGIKDHPGAVIYTLVNERVRGALETECSRLKVPCISVLNPVIEGLGKFFQLKISGRPGTQHSLNAEYFSRIEAMNYVMTHDDGQSTWDLEEADIVLIGVSRTSKTPTSIYLANHFGIKTANVPIVPGLALPPALFELDNPFVIGLTASPERLIQIRKNRLLMLKQDEHTDYVDHENVKREIVEARKLFLKHGWNVIDVTRRSIEETAAAIFQLYQKSLEAKNPETAVDGGA